MRRCLAAIAALALALAFPPTSGCLGEDFPWRDGQRVVFLGDSITHSGTYVQDIEAYLYTRFPDRKYEIIDLGLSSETVSGLTEPGHPYQRPDVRHRLARALQQARPNLVVVCYGMNDGIYHPPGAERLEAYRLGMMEVVDRIKKAGAEVVLATPPPFDPKPVAARLRPLGAPEYSYKNPFDGYDGVLGGYAEWLVSKRADGWKVVDVHTAVNRYVASLRELDPDYTPAPDGVHPDATGHWLIAQEILKGWDVPSEVDSASIDVQGQKSPTGIINMTRAGQFLTLTWTTRIPMPHDPKWDPRLVDREKVDERFNRHRLAVTGLDRPRYMLFEGAQKVGEFPREQLAEGIDMLRFPELSTNRRAAELRRLVVERHRALNPSWLESVGHGPPVLPEAPPLEVAKQRADAIEVRIRDLARPIPINLILVPIPEK
jgi:lysophospholipase L1-like esterase